MSFTGASPYQFITGASPYQFTISNIVTEKMNAYNSGGTSPYNTILEGKNCSINSPYQSVNITGVDNPTFQNKVEHNQAITKLFESNSTGMTTMQGLIEQRKSIIEKWDKLGLLDGLDLPNSVAKSNIAQLLECQAFHMLDEEKEVKKITPPGMKSIRLRYNHKATGKNDLWKVYVDGIVNFVSNVTFMCPTETTLDWDEETKDYKAHISCDANEVIFETKNNLISVIVKNI